MVRIHPDPPEQGSGPGDPDPDIDRWKQARGCSSVGRAPALQAGGRRFDPVQLHQSGSRRPGATRPQQAVAGSGGSRQYQDRAAPIDCEAGQRSTLAIEASRQR